MLRFYTEPKWLCSSVPAAAGGYFKCTFVFDRNSDVNTCSAAGPAIVLSEAESLATVHRGKRLNDEWTRMHTNKEHQVTNLTDVETKAFVWIRAYSWLSFIRG
jgi:hypothetical protein